MDLLDVHSLTGPHRYTGPPSLRNHGSASVWIEEGSTLTTRDKQSICPEPPHAEEALFDLDPDFGT